MATTEHEVKTYRVVDKEGGTVTSGPLGPARIMPGDEVRLGERDHKVVRGYWDLDSSPGAWVVVLDS